MSRESEGFNPNFLLNPYKAGISESLIRERGPNAPSKKPNYVSDFCILNKKYQGTLGTQVTTP